MASREIKFEVSVAPDGLDIELVALGAIVAALAPLDVGARRRVLRYLVARYAPNAMGFGGIIAN